MLYSELLEFAPNIPQKYMIDDETDLALNAPEQWTQSPYLGAVKSPDGKGYIAQIHIPQAVWVDMVQNNPAKWTNAPKTFFNSVGNQRQAMRVHFDDPRQAAWFAQEVLYGGDWEPKDVIEDYFEEKYCGGDGAVWRDIKSKCPNFDGAPLQSTDKDRYFRDPEEFRKARQQQKNAGEYETKMPAKIKKALFDFYIKNSKLAERRFGMKFKHKGELEKAISDVVDARGVDYFVTGPGSVKMKDIASLPMK